MSQPQPHHIRKFIHNVWRYQPTGIAFLSAKDWETGDWSEYPQPHFDTGDLPTAFDLYFCPNIFTESRRLRKFATGGRWLYADLDEVDPRELTDILPTLAWETSPGRYQALWLLDRTLSPRRLEKLNQQLTYFTGADKGGWSLTKVLRVPGSVSTKHGSPHLVKPVLLPQDRRVPLAVEDVTALLKDVETAPGTTPAGKVPHEDDLPDRAAVLRRRRRIIPSRAKHLLRTKDLLESDDRSARLWELENLLIDAGLKPTEVLVLVRGTIWNKWAGRRNELAQLWREIAKVQSNAKSPPKTSAPKPSSPTGLLPNSLSYDDFMRREWPKPAWLVEDCWTEGAYGILAGEYKAFKTMIALDLALSVASGESFLGKYPVTRPGHVCYVHEEGRPWSIHDRMGRIAYSKGLTDRSYVEDNGNVSIEFSGRSLPMTVTSLPGINLRDEQHQAAVAKHVEATSPRLVILETFYLLSGGAAETQAEEVSPILEFMAMLSHTYGTAVLMSHHFHKSREDKRFLDRVSGSNIFLRWYESGLFVERIGEEHENKIQIVSSHRDGKTTKNSLQVLWDSEDETSYAYNWLDDDAEVQSDIEAAERMIDLGTGGQSKRRKPKLVRDWAKTAGLNANDAAKHLQKQGYTIGRDDQGRRTFFK